MCAVLAVEPNAEVPPVDRSQTVMAAVCPNASKHMARAQANRAPCTKNNIRATAQLHVRILFHKSRFQAFLPFRTTYQTRMRASFSGGRLEVILETDCRSVTSPRLVVEFKAQIDQVVRLMACCACQFYPQFALVSQFVQISDSRHSTANN